MTLTVLWPFGYPASSSSASKVAATTPTKAVDLKHYANPNVSPPSARIDRNHKARVRRPLRFWHLWKYAAFAATKGMELSAAVLAHHIWGPRKKSWGIEMTIITAFMRGAGKNSSLINIPTIRTLMSLGGLAPLPSDALVTPVTFRVKKRGLRGMLAEYDERETGSRGLSAEWVVGKRTWLRLQADWKEMNRAEPCRSSPRSSRERVVLYIHGGAYYTSSAAAQRLISIPLAKHTDSRVFALDYRLAPETQFPGPLHDAVSAYLRLTEDLHIPPENILVAGDSAGGGLCLALLMYLRDNSYPLPSGAILMSPWVDLTMSCESWDSNSPFDVLPIPTTLPDDQLNPIALYLGDNVKRYLTHPYASPLFGDFKGLPPMLIQAGDAEVLRDEISLLAHKATSMGVQVRHEVYEDGIHIFQAYPFFQATAQAFISCRDFVRNILPNIEGSIPQDLAPDAEAELEHEIGNNEKATVVRGDGVMTGAGMKEVNEEFGHTGSQTETDSSEEDAPTSTRFKSWGRSTKWIIPADDEDESDDDAIPTPPTTPVLPTTKLASGIRRRRSETLPHASLRFTSLSSALPLVIPDSSLSSRSPKPPSISRPRQHRRTSSHHNCHLPDCNTSQSSSFSHTQSFDHGPLPSPSIRRSNVSHPDISSLVSQWTNTGPANQTYMYKHHQ